MGITETNELITLPWMGLSAQFHNEIERSIKCALKDWHFDTGTKIFKVGSARLARYRVKVDLDSANFYSSIDSPPGYEKLSHTHLALAAPLNGTWSAGLTLQFTSLFRVWNRFGNILKIEPTLRQTIKIRKFRVKGSLDLNTDEADRPRLTYADVGLRLQLVLKGFIDKTITIPPTALEFEPPDTYRLRTRVSGTFNTISGLQSVGIEGDLVITFLPKLEIGFEGALVFTLVKISGHKVKVEIPLRFNIDTGVGTRNLLDDYIPRPGQLPRDWGENPPLSVVNGEGELPLPPDTYDFITPALQFENAILPSDSNNDPIPTGVETPHHVPYGLVYEIRYFCGEIEAKKPIYEGIHDIAIWTGHYLAAESFRHAVDKSPDTLKRVNFVLGGIKKLFAVTQDPNSAVPGINDPGLFARAALPKNSPFDTDPSISSSTQTQGTECKPGEEEKYYQADNLDGETWCGFGRGEFPISRDSYMGVMMGLMYAYLLVDDQNVKDSVRSIVTDAIKFLIRHNWNVPTPPKGKIKTTFIHQFHQQLAILRLGKTVNNPEFGKLYDHFSKAADSVWIPIWGTVLEPLSKYYKFNLSHAAMSILLVLENDRNLRKLYHYALRILWRSVRHHRNAYFDLVRIICELPTQREMMSSQHSWFNKHYNLKEEIRLLLRDWLVRTKCIAGPLGLPTERPPDPAYLKSLVAYLDDSSKPQLAVEYTTIFETSPSCEWFSLYAMPVHKRPGYGMDFVWQRPPFSTNMMVCKKKGSILEEAGHSVLVGAGRPDFQVPGVDYLLPAWMAAYLKLITVPG